MTEHNDSLLLDHDFDGIRELDNKLPRWWVWLFYLTIAFAIFYLSYYHVFAKGDLARKGQMVTEYQAEVKVGEALKVVAMAKFEVTISTLRPSQAPDALANGKK